MRYADLSEKQRKFLDGYFRNEIYPILTPQAIDSGHPFPHDFQYQPQLHHPAAQP